MAKPGQAGKSDVLSRAVQLKRLGNGPVFISEADEYDRSFLTLFPEIAIITSIEADHMDIYHDLQDIRDTFITFANQGSKTGTVICCLDDTGVAEIIPHISRKVITYGFSEKAMYRPENEFFTAAGTDFDVRTSEGHLGRFKLSLRGKHNILNSLASIICSLQIGLSLYQIAKALPGFEGVERRFEIKGLVNDIMIVDDYAHHPTEVAATLASARTGWNRRLVVLFQPHLFSRTRDFFRDFVSTLAEADLVFLAPVYPAREEPLPGVSSQLLFDEAQNQGYHQFQLFSDPAQMAETVCGQLQPGDLFITIGAGDIWKTGVTILKMLQINEKAKI